MVARFSNRRWKSLHKLTLGMNIAKDFFPILYLLLLFKSQFIIQLFKLKCVIQKLIIKIQYIVCVCRVSEV